MMKTTEKLIARLRKIMKLPDDIEIRRTRCGSNQKGAGAWSWVGYTDCVEVIASPHSVGWLLKQPRLCAWYGWNTPDHVPEIDPVSIGFGNGLKFYVEEL